MQFRTIEVSDPRFEREGLRHVTFKSPALHGRADVTLFVPDDISDQQDVPVVILLHGVYGSHWAWAEKAGAHRTAARLIKNGSIPPMVLAMPSDGLWGDGSGYVKHGGNGGSDFERYIVDELPACVATIVPAITQSPAVFIAGLSMGGFGALRLGSKYPDRFKAVAAHSSITHFSQMAKFVEEPLESYGAIDGAEQSVLHFMTANRDRLPPIRFDCGIEDPLINENRALHNQLVERQIPHTYQENPGGHEWPYWERHLEDTLYFFGQH